MLRLNMESIRYLCLNGKLRWTNHVLVRLFQRNIKTDDVVYALLNGEIIEVYKDDYPYPSCLVLGITIAKKCLHVVCAVTDIELWLITAYYPNIKDWCSDFKTRKGGKNEMPNV